MSKPYYMAYEQRYRAVFSAGAQRWGHSPEDAVLRAALTAWVEENHLQGKRIVEFACGEGACGVILSQLGCAYCGVDVSPAAIEKSRAALAEYPNASACVLDMVREQVPGEFDAALDCMGLHMLITDADRANYLRNAYAVLKPNAPMLFFRESYRAEGTYHGVVKSIDEWCKITGDDYETPQLRQVRNDADGRLVDVLIPLVPARAKDEADYRAEMEATGFCVEKFVPMEASSAIVQAASIYVRKPNDK